MHEEVEEICKKKCYRGEREIKVQKILRFEEETEMDKLPKKLEGITPT